MAASMKKVNQQDLRKLMKERRVINKKIDSPLAKYNNLGQLTCVVCNIQIKNEGLWSAHIVGKIHKDHIEALKKKKLSSSNSTTNATAVTKGEKRKLENSDPPNSHSEPESKKVATSPGPQTAPIKKTTERSLLRTEESKSIATSLLEEYSSSDEEENESSRASKSAPPEQNNPLSSLPADFFDNAPEASTSRTDEAMEVEEDDSGKNGDTSTSRLVVNSAEALPEGFFDDPILDAKVRKVEYKDPIEEEWEKFQKAIAEESTVSQAIIEEDLEESKAEREISEIDEQIHNWARVEALQKKKEGLRQAKQAQMDESEGNASADEQEFEEFLDWRAKGAWKQ